MLIDDLIKILRSNLRLPRVNRFLFFGRAVVANSILKLELLLEVCFSTHAYPRVLTRSIESTFPFTVSMDWISIIIC